MVRVSERCGIGGRRSVRWAERCRARRSQFGLARADRRRCGDDSVDASDKHADASEFHGRMAGFDKGYVRVQC